MIVYKLPFEFKKTLLAIALIINMSIIVWLLFLKLNLIAKVIFSLILFCLFLSLLVIFEASNSFIENLFFWVVIAIVASFLYWPSAIIILVFSILKLIDENQILHSRIKFPFLELISKNYIFFLLVSVISVNFLIYQNLINVHQFPLTFNSYSFFIENLNKVNKIFNLNLPLNEKLSVFLENYAKSQTKENEISALLLFINLPDKTMKELIYESLKNSWQNEKLRLWYILIILLVIDSIIYPLIYFSGKFISLLSLVFINLFSYLKLFRIENKSVNKEVLTL